MARGTKDGPADTAAGAEWEVNHRQKIVVVVGKTVPVLQGLKNVAKELVNGSIRLKLMPKLKGVFPRLEMGK